MNAESSGRSSARTPTNFGPKTPAEMVWREKRLPSPRPDPRTRGTQRFCGISMSLGCTSSPVAGFVPFPSGTAHQETPRAPAAEVPDPKMYCPELPWDLARLISAMMDKDPGNRPATAEEIYKRLKPFVLGGKTELKSLLKGMLSPSLAKPEYDPTSVRAKTASDSAILDALDRGGLAIIRGNLGVRGIARADDSAGDSPRPGLGTGKKSGSRSGLGFRSNLSRSRADSLGNRGFAFSPLRHPSFPVTGCFGSPRLADGPAPAPLYALLKKEKTVKMGG